MCRSRRKEGYGVWCWEYPSGADPSCEGPKISGSPSSLGDSEVKLLSSSKVTPALSGTNVSETNPA